MKDFFDSAINHDRGQGFFIICHIFAELAAIFALTSSVLQKTAEKVGRPQPPQPPPVTALIHLNVSGNTYQVCPMPIHCLKEG